MTGNAITVPVTATMERQQDGTYKMADAEYITADTDTLARFLMAAFDVALEVKL